MTMLGALRIYLEQHFPHTVGEEAACSCGASNHVRVRYFRVNGQPAAAIIPEGSTLTAGDLAEATGTRQVEPLLEEELSEIFTDTELGRMQPFENPFGAAVFFDDLLLPHRNVVFCPRMFSEQRGQCFRVPTQEILDLTHAVVLPLTGAGCRRSDEWAV